MSYSQLLCRRCCPAGTIALLIHLLPGLSAPASAQMTDRQWEVGFAVGSGNVDSSGEGFDLDFRADFRVGYIFSDHFELEVQVVRATAAPFDGQLSTVMLNGVFSFQPNQTIVPYVLVGGGYSELDDVSFLGTGLDVKEEAGDYQVGVGCRFFVGEGRRMAVRLELSSLWVDTDLFASNRHTSLTAGLSWALGSR